MKTKSNFEKLLQQHKEEFEQLHKQKEKKLLAYFKKEFNFNNPPSQYLELLLFSDGLRYKNISLFSVLNYKNNMNGTFQQFNYNKEEEYFIFGKNDNGDFLAFKKNTFNDETIYIFLKENPGVKITYESFTIWFETQFLNQIVKFKTK